MWEGENEKVKEKEREKYGGGSENSKMTTNEEKIRKEVNKKEEKEGEREWE